MATADFRRRALRGDNYLLPAVVIGTIVAAVLAMTLALGRLAPGAAKPGADVPQPLEAEPARTASPQ